MQSAILDGKRLVFEHPLRGNNVHLRLIGKRVVVLLLVLIELFCYVLPLRH